MGTTRPPKQQTTTAALTQPSRTGHMEVIIRKSLLKRLSYALLHFHSQSVVLNRVLQNA